MGLTDSDIANALQDFGTENFTAFRDVGGIVPFLTELKAQNSTLAVSLQGLALAMDSILADLVSQGFNVVPLANAGGPYLGNEGTAILFKRKRLDSPARKSSDLRLGLIWSGVFDDAAEVTPSHTYLAGLRSLIGLKVTVTLTVLPR